MAKIKKIKTKIEQIENEMKRIKLWQEEPLPPEQYDFRQAFAMDTMAFSQWLQFIFIPRVQQLVESKGPFPSESNVGVQALREMDGFYEANELVRMLSEFDQLFEIKTRKSKR